MRRFLFGATVISILLVVAGIGTTVALASAGPLQPGDTLFPLQYFAEQSQGKWTTSNFGEAQHHINIASRRAVDLGNAAGTSDETLSVYYLNQALDQAALSIAKTEKTEIENLRLSLAKLLLQIKDSTARLSVLPAEDPAVFNAFVAKIESLQNLVVNPDAVSSDFISIVSNNNFGAMLNVNVPNFVSKNNDLIASGSQSIPFPANSPGAQHAFFPLVGEHATIACESCHTNGQYEGTASTCEGCHANIKPANHYQGDCAACHTPTSWQSASFNHTVAGATDCQACHSRPSGHYSGQCSQCHSTSNWKGAAVHTAGADCQACHSRPSGHYSGQCSQCHSTSNWKGAAVHTVGADCQACHSRPSGHYSGQCSQCHSTSNWKGAAVHTAGADCQACHSRPSGHYSGQCSQCHSTSNWKGASVHTAGADCQACHSRPSGHYSGQCSQCHTTSNWHASGHFAGANCLACHSGHTKQQCSNCHNTSDWDDADGDDHDGGGDHDGGDHDGGDHHDDDDD